MFEEHPIQYFLSYYSFILNQSHFEYFRKDRYLLSSEAVLCHFNARFMCQREQVLYKSGQDCRYLSPFQAHQGSGGLRRVCGECRPVLDHVLWVELAQE